MSKFILSQTALRTPFLNLRWNIARGPLALFWSQWILKNDYVVNIESQISRENAVRQNKTRAHESVPSSENSSNPTLGAVGLSSVAEEEEEGVDARGQVGEEQEREVGEVKAALEQLRSGFREQKRIGDIEDAHGSPGKREGRCHDDQPLLEAALMLQTS